MDFRKMARSLSAHGTSRPVLAGALLLLSAGELQARKHPGVINCPSGCAVSVPNPDAGTLRVLHNAERKLNPNGYGIWKTVKKLRVGDILTVCNGIVCADYTWRGKNFDSGIEISNSLPAPARGGGGGGGSSGGGGSGPIGGGCHGNCGGGKVTVGDIQQQ